MKRSLIFAILGIILPSFIFSYSILGVDTIAILGLGWVYHSISTSLGSVDYFGLYLTDPRIFIIPNEWDGFNSIEGLGAEGFLRGYFIENSTISIHGLLLTIGFILAIVGLILINKEKTGAFLLFLSGASQILSLLLFNSNINFGSSLPIPIGSLLLIIAGFFAYRNQ